jgi:hypothetical protein
MVCPLEIWAMVLLHYEIRNRYVLTAAVTALRLAVYVADQTQQLNAAKKEIFNLQLENHFLKERLGNMAPDHIEAAVKENVKLKLEILHLSKEMKALKKLLLQQDKNLVEAQRERETFGAAKGRDGELKELERLYREEKDRRRVAEEELESARMAVDDKDEELEKHRDAADRALSELDKLRATGGVGSAETVEAVSVVLEVDTPFSLVDLAIA